MMVASHHTIPVGLNLLLCLCVSVLHGWAWIALPLLLLQDGYIWLLSLIPWLLCIPLHWALLHEAIHKLLHPNRKINDMLGRGLGILLFASFDGLRFGHLMHHRFNRQLDSEYYDESNHSRIGALSNYYLHLFGGLYVIEVLMPIMLALTPRRWVPHVLSKLATDYRGCYLSSLDQAAQRYFVAHSRHLKTLRIDCLLYAGVFTASCVAYQTFWPVFIGMVLIRGTLLSLHDNAYHYATPLDGSKAAKELALVQWGSKGMLHFNYHASHHAQAGTPWIGLPKIHTDQGKEFDESFTDAVVQQLRGPLPVRLAGRD